MFEISIPFAVELYVLHNKGMLNNVKKIYLRTELSERLCDNINGAKKCLLFFLQTLLAIITSACFSVSTL